MFGQLSASKNALTIPHRCDRRTDFSKTLSFWQIHMQIFLTRCLRVKDWLMQFFINIGTRLLIFLWKPKIKCFFLFIWRLKANIHPYRFFSKKILFHRIIVESKLAIHLDTTSYSQFQRKLMKIHQVILNRFFKRIITNVHRKIVKIHWCNSRLVSFFFNRPNGPRTPQ